MLKFQLDTLEGVDEAVRALYTEKDGKFVLGIEGLSQQEDVSGLNAKNAELLAKRKKSNERRAKPKRLHAWSVKRQLASPVTSKNSNGPGLRNSPAAKLSLPARWSRSGQR
jgi:hypothetical protein